ncbi:MAG: hypothetical protein J1E82_03420 [Muribaculaceae bacterium]|nr:hypothetical protein [Muribaculaceae bacterium]
MKKQLIFSFFTLLTAGSVIAQLNPVKQPLQFNAKENDKVFSTRASDISDAPELTDIILEAEGREQSFQRYGAGFFPMQGTVYQYFEDTDPSPSTIVFGSDNKTIYFKDIMDFGWDSYVVGSIEGSKITVKLPQTLCEEVYIWAEEPYYHNLCGLTQTGEGVNLDFALDESITEVTYTIGDDGSIKLDPLPEGKALGLMTYFIGKEYDDPEDENSDYTLKWLDYWSGAADYAQNFVPMAVELIEMPKDIEPTTYYCAIDGYNYPVDVAIDGNYMYIQGFGDSPFISNLVLRATIEGDKAYIPQNQYIGVYKLDNEMISTKCGYLKGNNIIYENDDVNFEFTIDSDRKFLEAIDKDLYLCLVYMNQFDSNGQNGLLGYYKNFYLIYQDSYPGVPSNPLDLFYSDMFYEDYGYYSFGFTMSAISTANNILLTGNLYYSIYIDGELELFEYDPDGWPYSHYYMLPEPTTEVPFMFTNDNDLDIWSPTDRQVGIYYEGVSTVGVQGIYYYDDQRTCSDIVTLDVETGEVTTTPAGVDTLINTADVVKTEYIDLNGRKVTNPQAGIFIKKSVLSNGRIITSKVVRK